MLATRRVAQRCFPRRCYLRGYRGEAGEGQSFPKRNLEEEAIVTANQIMAKHIEIPQDESIRRKRLIYRAKQRGWLEVDLLLGTFASQVVPTLSTKQELDDFERLVNLETIDLYNLVTLRVSEENSDNVMIGRLQEWARNNPLGKADPETYKSMKKQAQLI